MPHGCRTGAKTRLCPKCKSYYKPIEPSDPCPGCGLPGDEHEAYIEQARAEAEQRREAAMKVPTSDEIVASEPQMTRPVDAGFYEWVLGEESSDE